MVLPAIEHGGYSYQKQVCVGKRPNGRRHVVDVLIRTPKRRIAVSLKWQQVSGTAEQKIPFEVICLAEAVDQDQIDVAYLVLGGTGWTLRDYYVSGRWRKWIRGAERVRLVKLEDFVAKANKGAL